MTQQWIIVSDNHTEQGILYEVISNYTDVDVALHLGDSEFAYNDTELSYYTRVKGNTDFYPEFPNETQVKQNDIRAFVTHGHLYQVNMTRQYLAQKAREEGCQFAFYGHTHIAKYENIGGVHVINPGSISQSRSDIEETYAQLLIDEDRQHATLHFRNRDHAVIDTVEFDI
ncbi:uncharacterized protein ACUW9N_000240 [Staphylococcus auricularis]|uniref:Phosphoesterase n=1 Tax=Staphylococcus auricularis TaxID=29379 RepID=A0AAP8PN11_9STAP|nr:metallophosphoesterase [Staphylococcus auricularis]MBM0867630.1 metallophosphoesterase [Staphylococcus auricularis]MCG7340496.1 metallophosphoesterase [Staphylococcus auricularis]MDC6326449.1 metallophosphoesterase [Staphylococcus auricularis]MDN4532326.1 metallophosphoesterase [Staphylococcus auricularis]PNZ65877.1 metallophosphoesterase [Staphylococcus auricularis]